jgi:hypothetical protein
VSNERRQGSIHSRIAREETAHPGRTATRLMKRAARARLVAWYRREPRMIHVDETARRALPHVQENDRLLRVYAR